MSISCKLQNNEFLIDKCEDCVELQVSISSKYRTDKVCRAVIALDSNFENIVAQSENFTIPRGYSGTKTFTVCDFCDYESIVLYFGILNVNDNKIECFDIFTAYTEEKAIYEFLQNTYVNILIMVAMLIISAIAIKYIIKKIKR